MEVICQRGRDGEISSKTQRHVGQTDRLEHPYNQLNLSPGTVAARLTDLVTAREFYECFGLESGCSVMSQFK